MPVLFDPWGYQEFLPLKWTVGLGLVLAGLTLTYRQYGGFRDVPLAKQWAALLGVLVLATLTSVSRLSSLIGSGGRNLGLIALVGFAAAYFLGAWVADLPQSGVLITRAVAIGALVVSGYALVQVIGLDPLHWDPTADLVRARSTLGSASFLGAYLAMVVPICVRLSLDPGSALRWRRVFALASVSSMGALLVSFTRGAWIGAAIGLIVMAVLEWHRFARLTRLLMMWGAVAAVVLVGALAVVGGSQLSSSLHLDRATGSGRIVLWDRTIQLIGRRPILGWGPDTFAVAFPHVANDHFEQSVGRTVLPDRAHDSILDAAVTSGVIGAATWLVLGVSILATAARRIRRTALSVALFGGIAGYMVQALVGFSLADLDLVFWLLAGLLVASSGESPARGSFKRRSGGSVVLAVVATVTVVWAGRDVVADRALRRAFDAEAAGNSTLAAANMKTAVDWMPERPLYHEAAALLALRAWQDGADRRRLDEAVAQNSAARHLSPHDEELAIDRGDILLAVAQRDGVQPVEAEMQYRSILRSDPSSSRTWLKLGVALAQSGQTSAADMALTSAARLAPRAPEPWLDLGLLHRQEGRVDQARADFERALRRDRSNSQARAELANLPSGQP